ncbi:MAG: isochorismatase family protein [Peptococcaceae bacterium]|jgi:nicotinamidase-related amidase|nr:isochorismatase family protein [Peptococcaceae bacterium]
MRNYSKELLDPTQVAICIIDEQPQMFFGVESASRLSVMNAVTGLAKTASIFQIPVILSTVEAQTFSGPLYNQVQLVFPKQQPIDRTTLNAWEDKNFKTAVSATGKKKLLFAGLWTEVCVTLPTLCALSDGFEVYIVTDASAGASKEAHQMSIVRMTQAGAKPVTWQAALLEMQRDWANKTTYQAVMQVITEHGGAYGLGVEYANAMVPQSQ